MCGISGIYNFNQKPVDRRVLTRMNDAIKHRGPDDSGILIQNNIGIANRRLAIIGPTKTGKQPMVTSDGRFAITFNGEIFNYKELKKDLFAKGYRFGSDTDTEVLLYGYIHYGYSVLNKLIGQFAFCIWDKKKENMILARDQMGINPLYYAKTDNSFIFSSEIKGILASGLAKKEINLEAIHHYLSIFSIPAPLTIIKGVNSLLPGYFVVIDKKGITKHKYWEIPVASSISYAKYNDLKNELEKQLISSVNRAEVADVSIGAFLSGGLDSSIAVALMAGRTNKPIKTFSLWAQGGEAFDERKYARLIANQYKTDHTECTVSEKEIVQELPKIIYYFDQPTGGSFENYFISKITSGKVKVALSGLGSDELFAGYHAMVYKYRFLSGLYKNIPSKLQNLVLGLSNYILPNEDMKKTLTVADKFLSLPNALKKRLFLYFAFDEAEKRKLYSKSYLTKTKKYDTDILFDKLFEKVKDRDPIDQLGYIDLNTYTRDDLLLGTNMMSMANSLEVRVPFLDKELVEFSYTIPSKYKYKNGISKYILRDIAKKWLPQEVINHKKIGFGLPRVQYMNGCLKPYILSWLSPQSVKKRGIFDEKFVNDTVNQFYNHKSAKRLWNEHLRVWLLFVLEIWFRIYIDDSNIEVPSYSLLDMS